MKVEQVSPFARRHRRHISVRIAGYSFGQRGELSTSGRGFGLATQEIGNSRYFPIRCFRFPLNAELFPVSGPQSPAKNDENAIA
jgi:hypothetical protein